MSLELSDSLVFSLVGSVSPVLPLVGSVSPVLPLVGSVSPVLPLVGSFSPADSDPLGFSSSKLSLSLAYTGTFFVITIAERGALAEPLLQITVICPPSSTVTSSVLTMSDDDVSFMESAIAPKSVPLIDNVAPVEPPNAPAYTFTVYVPASTTSTLNSSLPFSAYVTS